MTPKQIGELRKLVVEFIAYSSAPRSLNGRDCDHCGSAGYHPHTANCAYKMKRDELKKLVFDITK